MANKKIPFERVQLNVPISKETYERLKRAVNNSDSENNTTWLIVDKSINYYLNDYLNSRVTKLYNLVNEELNSDKQSKIIHKLLLKHIKMWIKENKQMNKKGK